MVLQLYVPARRQMLFNVHIHMAQWQEFISSSKYWYCNLNTHLVFV